MDQSGRQYLENSQSVKLLTVKPEYKRWSGWVLAGCIPGRKGRWNAVEQYAPWGKLPLTAFHKNKKPQKTVQTKPNKQKQKNVCFA